MGTNCFASNRVLPSSYSEEITYYEEVCKLQEKVNQLINDFKLQTETYATIKMLNDSQDNQDKKFTEELLETYNNIMDYTKSEINRLEKLISEAIAGKVIIFDPTYGIEPRPVEQVVKNVYHWLRYYADNAITFDNLNLTVEKRDSFQITAKDFDLYSMLYYSKNNLPEPSPGDEYVKKHDILAYYFDRLDVK